MKPYRGDTEVRQSVRHENRPPPICEEIPNEIETEEENEDRLFHVLKPTTAESQAARNRPKVKFSQVPENVEQDYESQTEIPSRDESIDVQASSHLTAYETIPGDDAEKSESEQTTVGNGEPENLLEEDHDS